MSSTDTKILGRIDQLIKKAHEVLATRRSNASGVVGKIRVDRTAFHAWKASTENVIKITCGEESNYYKTFQKVTESGAYEMNVQSAAGILFAVKEDVEAGLITSIKDLAFAEVFTDFIEMSEYLLSQGYKDPAASLCGAVLEDGLRKISDNNNLQYSKSDGLDSLSQKLVKASVLSALDKKNIDVWRTIRNDADHGNFSNYNEEDVGNMVSGIFRFLGDNL